MQCLALQIFEFSIIRAVNRVTQKGMSDMCHVDTNLMCAASLQSAFDIIEFVVQMVEDTVMGDCPLPGFRYDFPLLSIYRMSADRFVDRPLFFGKIVLHDGMVCSVYRVCPKLLGQAEMGVVIFTDDERSSRVFVDPVDDAGTQHSVDTGQMIPTVIHDGVDQCVGIMSVRGMYDEAFGLVYDQNIIVLIQNVQRDILGFDFQRSGGWQMDTDLVAKRNGILRLDSKVPVYTHAVFLFY